MLAARRLPEALKTILCDGLEGCCLMTSEGSLLCAQVVPGANLSETTLAAISSSIWNNFQQQQQGSPQVQLYLMKFEKGCLGITSAGNGYVLAAYGGDKIPCLGLLRGRLEALSTYFTRVFEQLNNN